MSVPILPPRPLRLRRSFAAVAIARATVALAPALAVIGAACVWQARAAWEIADDARGFEEGAEVALLTVSREERVVFGVVHDVVAHARYVDPQGVERQGGMRWLALFGAGTDGEARGRVDPARGRLVLSWAVDAGARRWAWTAVASSILLALLGAALRAARALLGEYLVARRAARASEEVELEVLELATHDVHGKPAVLEVRFRAPRAPDAPTGYRESAGGSDEVRRARFRLADGDPVLLDGGARALALRPTGSRDVLLVREDLWPFALAASDAARALERARHRQPESADASPWEGPASGMGTQAPASSNT